MENNNLFKGMLTFILGILYGVFSLYSIAIGAVAAFNLFANDIGYTEEDYASLIPMGYMILLFYVLISFFIIRRVIRTKQKWLFLGAAVVSLFGSYFIFK